LRIFGDEFSEVPTPRPKIVEIASKHDGKESRHGQFRSAKTCGAQGGPAVGSRRLAAMPAKPVSQAACLKLNTAMFPAGRTGDLKTVL
jgi:hypothetical protein